MFRRLLIPALACLALVGCSFGSTAGDHPAIGSPPVASAPATSGPAAFADRTVLDEKAATGVELAYKAARTACELAVDLGRIKGPTATRFRALNRDAFAAVKAVRAAYDAGNSRSYGEALGNAQSLVGQLLGLAGGGK